jgi:Fe-S-cluster containining protein
MEMYRHLDRGDGLCMYYDSVNTKCNIYDSRPVICNIYEMYNLYYKDIMTKSEYEKICSDGCSLLSTT